MAAVREGDWMCPQCGNHNYASRTFCNRCQAAKQGVVTPAGAYAVTPAYGAAKGTPLGKGATRRSPYGGQFGGAAPMATPLTQGEGTRPGDWVCTSCNNHNYANRIVCNRCGGPKVALVDNFMMGNASSIAHLGTVASMAGMGSFINVKPGDWMCAACKNHNYADKVNCNRCQIPKSARIAKTGMREGDWICPTCSNHNYADKVVCNKCSGPKGATSSYGVQPAGSPLGHNARPGDWICTVCSNHNYASRTQCNKCASPKTV
eukprot:CAMPEP_0170594116 /NCGR_PEP_ID=MMETSP0224-20130122/13825_1 /TAXON_ID=285029 /ORGANISM="Togula jolla, Strain CCCM 725" /LENGTH=261 /DNA_ID=CAMNT_0010918145 /DNA_START=72 /DNA_END=857 /DNA_ORIENTATION=-